MSNISKTLFFVCLILYIFVLLFFLTILLRVILFSGHRMKSDIFIRNDIDYDFSNENIIGYIHVCQKEYWDKSFDMLWEKIVESGLYDECKEIRIGILTDEKDYWKNDKKNQRFNDPKIKIIYFGKTKEYERPTLLHMRKQSFIDPMNTKYFYLHTKGLRHFGTNREDDLIYWINKMLYHNITKWKKAVLILNEYGTYGINFNNYHYSGNFWWTNAKHMQTRNQFISSEYTGPEKYVLENLNKMQIEKVMHCEDTCFDKGTGEELFNIHFYARSKFDDFVRWFRT